MENLKGKVKLKTHSDKNNVFKMFLCHTATENRKIPQDLRVVATFIQTFNVIKLFSVSLQSVIRGFINLKKNINKSIQTFTLDFSLQSCVYI